MRVLFRLKELSRKIFKVLGTSKLSAVVASDLSGLIGTTEVVSNETNRIVTGIMRFKEA